MHCIWCFFLMIFTVYAEILIAPEYSHHCDLAKMNISDAWKHRHLFIADELQFNTVLFHSAGLSIMQLLKLLRWSNLRKLMVCLMSDITEYRCYELTLGCLFSYLEQANALLLWANKQSCIFSSRYISTCSITRMMNICSSVIYVIGT